MNTKFQLTDHGLMVALSTPHVKAHLKPMVSFDHDLATLNHWLSQRIAVRHGQGYAAEDAGTLALFDLSIAQSRGLLTGEQGVADDPTMIDLLRFDLFPRLLDHPDQEPMAFAPMVNTRPGVYPIVDRLDDLRRLLDAGAEIIQLRIKSTVFTPEIDRAISDAVRAASHYPAAQLLINDYWQAAITHGAFGIHLGQEDLLVADLPAIAKAGIRLGVSSHAFWEVARAARISPSTIACGPVFPTRAKVMPWIPQGVENLRYWTALLPFPVIGIGGVNAANLADIHATGCAGAAVIQAVTADPDPAQAYQRLQAAWRSLDAAKDKAESSPKTAPGGDPPSISLARPTLAA
jgi:hydroxymethylpyrimidine kinase / phosphomethylpyrimidine kinase / thiamine-phosphate diphosphorylase